MQHHVLIALMTLAACASMDQDEKLDQYMRHELAIPAAQEPEVIISITEQGCPVCSRAFADMARPFITAPNCIVIVRATGSSIDLTGLMGETPTMHHDEGGKFRALGLLEGSGLIFLDQGRIDTVIPLRTAGFEQQLDFMETRLKSALQQPK